MKSHFQRALDDILPWNARVNFDDVVYGRVTIKDTHIKVDGCVGQSFLRSYATLTSSTADTDDIVAYYGVTKSV